MRDLTQERIRELIEAAASVARQVDLSSLLESTVDTAMELTGAGYGALGVLGTDGLLVDFIHSAVDEEWTDKMPHPPRGEGVLGTITRDAETIRIADIREHPDSIGFPEGHPSMTTFLGSPVRVGDQVFGNLYLADKPDGFTHQDEVLIDLLAVAAGTAVSTLRMQERLRRLALQADRERIALDLHDSIIQDLFAVGLGLQSAAARVEKEPQLVRERLSDAVDRLDATIAALRRYIFDLNPPVWVRPGRTAVIEDLAESLSSQYDRDVETALGCDLEELSQRTFEHVQAVVKEALSNALRHSGAATIGLEVSCTDASVTATVRDDGKGFAAGDPHTGLGLGNLRHRAESEGGVLMIDSVPGSGTTVSVTFPL